MTSKEVETGLTVLEFLVRLVMNGIDAIKSGDPQRVEAVIPREVMDAINGVHKSRRAQMDAEAVARLPK